MASCGAMRGAHGTHARQCTHVMLSSTTAVDEWVQSGGVGINLLALTSDYINTPIIFGVLSKSYFFSQIRDGRWAARDGMGGSRWAMGDGR